MGKRNSKLIIMTLIISLFIIIENIHISYADSSTQIPIYRTDTINISTIQTSTTDSFKDTIDYSDANGYKGTYNKNGSSYVYSGSDKASNEIWGYWNSNGQFIENNYTPPEDKWTVSDWKSSNTPTPVGHTVYKGSLDSLQIRKFPNGSYVLNTDYFCEYTLDKTWFGNVASKTVHVYPHKIK